MTRQLLVTRCPSCGKICDTHDATDPAARPQAGDVSLCWGCREPAVYVDVLGHLGLRTPTAEERTAIVNESAVRRALAAMAEAYSGDQAAQLLRGAR